MKNRCTVVFCFFEGLHLHPFFSSICLLPADAESLVLLLLLHFDALHVKLDLPCKTDLLPILVVHTLTRTHLHTFVNCLSEQLGETQLTINLVTDLHLTHSVLTV